MIHLVWPHLDHLKCLTHSCSGFVRPALTRPGARPPGSQPGAQALPSWGRGGLHRGASTVLQLFMSQSIPEGWLCGMCTLHLPHLQSPPLEHEHNSSTHVIGLSWRLTELPHSGQGLAHICVLGVPATKMIVRHTYGPPCCQFFHLIEPLAHPALLGNL